MSVAPTLDTPRAELTPSLSDRDLLDLLQPLRRHLHQHPEIGFALENTSQHVRAWLEAHGFTVTHPLAKTGFFVEIHGAHPGPMLGYRADMDALPIQDAKDAPYASAIPGRAHLCGHDAHTAIACGVAMLLRERRADLYGSVRVFFQPNEESAPSGAPVMIDDGVLEGLAAVFAVHVDPALSAGKFGLRVGPLTAAATMFDVRVKSGLAGHSARPHETVDTIWLATQILQQYYQLAGRVTDARKTSILTACRFQGGDAYNVIPSEVRFGGTLRTASRGTHRMLLEKLRRVAGALGALYGADVDVDFGETLPPVVNEPACIASVHRAAATRYGSESVRELTLPSMGGEDFSFYLEKIPGAMVRIGSSCSPETRYPLHHALFDLDETAMPLAARLMCDTLLDYAQAIEP
ncbi:MAG: amidohydrolase [Bacteroidota bacterium]